MALDEIYEIKETAYGGRGVFARTALPQDTIVHVCAASYASVIFREFRKDVCANCFAYAPDGGEHTWKVRPSTTTTGEWFCGQPCREIYEADHCHQLRTQAATALDKATNAMKKIRPPGFDPSRNVLAAVNEPVSKASVDLAWKEAEDRLRKKRGNHLPTFLDDSEVDYARLVVSAMVNRDSYTQESSPFSSWTEFLELQDNELDRIRYQPSTLDSHIRVYTFLHGAVPSKLKHYVNGSTTVRAVLARDWGNSFGIWQLPTGPGSEMFGYAIYVSASFFNHNCEPNVRKQREGRSFSFYTTRPVQTGEELCISYGDVQKDVEQRQKALKDGWYFDCVCQRCTIEAAHSMEG